GIKILEDTSKLPDIILYDADKNRIIYVEAYSSTGEFNKDRVDYINTYFSYKNDIEVAFVTAFATTKKMLQVYPKIAWDTEIWIAEEATHLTHKNGDRFMGRNPEEFL
ncbi:MAG: BsuBI/PstI family type II restriction endonuclease, partial [Anaerostipes hadrus]